LSGVAIATNRPMLDHAGKMYRRSTIRLFSPGMIVLGLDAGKIPAVLVSTELIGSSRFS
jgi:hypothetical protein